MNVNERPAVDRKESAKLPKETDCLKALSKSDFASDPIIKMLS